MIHNFYRLNFIYSYNKILAIFAFFWWLALLSIFSCACWPLVCSLKNRLFRSFAIFKMGLFFMWSSVSCLYILDINLFGHIISRYILTFSKLSFNFVDGFLCCAKALKFNWIPFVYFCFCFLCLRSQIQNILLKFMSMSVLLMFPYRSFFVSLTFRSVINFEFIFVYGVRKCSNFIVLYATVQFSQHHLLKMR